MEKIITLCNINFIYDEEDDIYYDEKFKYRFYKASYSYKMFYGGFDEKVCDVKKVNDLSIEILKYDRKIKLNKINKK